MARKKGKAVSFDAMVKFFLHHYGIPTKKDVDKLIARLDRLEKAVKASARAGAVRRAGGRGAAGRTTMTATDTVLNCVQQLKDGASFNDIQAQTGFGDKKLRNIIFRLHKLNKIKRKTRGVYTAV